ncbi:MAG: gamma-glutamyltransferase [Gammaproteobacteria bacterium]
MMHRSPRRLLLALCLYLPLSVTAVEPAPSENAIASAHALATAAGHTVLAAGGNAFDAAIAVAAALAVVEPYSSGIGGGGFFLVHDAHDGHDSMIDARETAPGAATPTMFLDADGKVAPSRSLNGALAAGIPGLPAGLVFLAKHYGRLPLAQDLAPAIALAEAGFEVSEHYAVMAGFRAPAFKAGNDAHAIFLRDGKAPPLGTVLTQPDLARTLRALAERGEAGFYSGDIAARLVKGVHADGGIWTKQDLADYHVRERVPLVGHFHDIRIVSAAPPSSGGVVMMEALNILENFALDTLAPVDRMHVVLEAMRLAYRDRADYLGDPDFVEMPIAHLLDKSYARELSAKIDLAHATPSASLPPIRTDDPNHHTTHFSVLDTAGNRVAATLSVNYPFGAASVPAGTGVLLNNEMDDFATSPLTPNAYGLVGGSANAVGPGRRPLSSMTPTFLEGPERIGILGTPGGSRIISMVLIGVLEYARGEDPDKWVSAPRYHHQYLPDQVEFEAGGLDAATQAALAAKGHKLNENKRRYGNMQAILWDRASGKVKAASDPRGEGKAEAWAPAAP